MTKKEYILDFLKEINYAYNHPSMYDDLKRLLDEMEEEILRSANEALDQEQCEDCIRRSDIGLTDFEIVMCNGDYKEGLKMLLDKIEKAPSVTSIPKMGKWIKVIEENGHAFYLCSVCKEGTDENYDWCPYCGARMREDKE